MMSTTEVTEPKKKGNFFAGFKHFFVGYKSEWKKIVWPTFKQVRNNTIVTIAMIFLVGIFIWVLDFLLGLGLKELIGFLPQ